MAFRVGQKVVCVNADALLSGYGPHHDEITVGEVYTIRWAGPSPHPRTYGKPAIRLVGVVRGDDPGNPDWNDMPWMAIRFRPVVERKTDISVFTKMLTDTKIGADA